MKTPQEHLRSLINKSCHELLDLREGCEIEVETILFFNNEIEGDKSKATVLWYDAGGYNGEDYDGDTLCVYSYDWNVCKVWGEHGDGDDYFEIPEYKVIGTPPTLEHLLRAINTQRVRFCGDTNEVGHFERLEEVDVFRHTQAWKFYCKYDLTRSPLNQDTETIKQLISIVE